MSGINPIGGIVQHCKRLLLQAQRFGAADGTKLFTRRLPVVCNQPFTARIQLHVSAPAGGLSNNCFKLVEGTVDNEEQSFLDDEQVADGWILTCTAYPTSDCVILTEQEENL